MPLLLFLIEDTCYEIAVVNNRLYYNYNIVLPIYIARITYLCVETN